MDRRDFVKNLILSSAVTGSWSATALYNRLAFAGHGTPTFPRMLVNIMLLGGSDLRYLFAPKPGHLDSERSWYTNYATAYWQAREALYVNGGGGLLYPPAGNYDDIFDNEYLETVYDPTGPAPLTFGIHKNADWLKGQFDLGNVAIVRNAYGSENRRHDHSQLIVEAGDPDADRLITNRDGWGGRLVEAISGDARVVPVSGNVSVFSLGTDADNRLARVIHAKDSRNIALASGSLTNNRSIISRAATAWYAARGRPRGAAIGHSRRPARLNSAVRSPRAGSFRNLRSLRRSTA